MLFDSIPLDELTAARVSGAVVVLAGAIVGLWKVFRNFQRKRRKIDRYNTVHSVVHELLSELRVLSGADRAMCLILHNFQYTIDGISLQKFSLSHESARKEMASHVQSLSGVLCSLFVPVLQVVVDDTPRIVRVTDLQDSWGKNFLAAENIQYIAVLPVRRRGMITAFVMLEWTDNPPSQESIDRILPSIRDRIEVQMTQMTDKA